jgi:hypothetical protein
MNDEAVNERTKADYINPIAVAIVLPSRLKLTLKTILVLPFHFEEATLSLRFCSL